MGNRAAAEDIAQEAFITAYLQLASFDPSRSRFSTWLYKIAGNKAIDYVRAQKRVLPAEDMDLYADLAVPDYEAQEQCQLVRDAVSRLQPPTHRQAIQAYYWEGKSYQAIASELCIPINTVRTWLRRAKQQLRSELS